jgi:hypothetical protein
MMFAMLAFAIMCAQSKSKAEAEADSERFEIPFKASEIVEG